MRMRCRRAPCLCQGRALVLAVLTTGLAVAWRAVAPAGFLSASKLAGSSLKSPNASPLQRPQIALVPAAASGEQASKSQKEGAGFELWCDFRAGRYRVPGANVFASTLQVECPKVKETLLELLKEIKEKLRDIGSELPKGKVVDGVIVDDQFGKAAMEEVQGLGLPVYVASKEIEGVKLPGRAFFVCAAEDGMPIGCLSSSEVLISAVQRQSPHEVWTIEAEDPATKAARKKEEEEEMKRYEEGLKDESKYVLPPRKRLRELLGVQNDGGALPVTKGKLLAKTLPPDPLLWGRALMMRLKASGVTVVYSLKSDREAAAAAAEAGDASAPP